MGSRDYSRHEEKKPKKGAKKLPTVTVAQTPVEVQVIKKGKKPREGEAEAEE